MDSAHFWSSLFNIEIWILPGLIFGITSNSNSKRKYPKNIYKIVSSSLFSLFIGLLVTLNFGFPEAGIGMDNLILLISSFCLIIFFNKHLYKSKSVNSSNIK